MPRICTFIFLFVGVATAASAQTMTYHQAGERIPERALPTFWVADVAQLPARWAGLTAGEAGTIAQSPGERPIHLITYGRREQVQHKANFNSAIGAREPAAYMDKDAREKPVVLFIGPVHGHEVEGLVGLVNLVHVMETGHDLRGRDQSPLRALARQCRLLIIPAGNPDGIARFEPRTLVGMTYEDLRFWGQGTWADHTFCGWPQVKRQHPMVGDNVGFLGCYFNDAGINPMHDEFFAPMGTEARAILDVAREEGPDLAVSLHSFDQSPTLLRPTYVTREIQEQVRATAERFYALLEQKGLPHGRLFTAQDEHGPAPAPFNLVSALYHVSGAAAFTFECPHGLSGSEWCQVSLGQILDTQLALYEATFVHALGWKSARLREQWER